MPATRNHYPYIFFIIVLVFLGVANAQSRRPDQPPTVEPLEADSVKYGKGMQAYAAGNYPVAVRWFEEAANLGHKEAMLQIGLMYDFGRGVAHDFKQARPGI